MCDVSLQGGLLHSHIPICHAADSIFPRSHLTWCLDWNQLLPVPWYLQTLRSLCKCVYVYKWAWGFGRHISLYTSERMLKVAGAVYSEIKYISKFLMASVRDMTLWHSTLYTVSMNAECWALLMMLAVFHHPLLTSCVTHTVTWAVLELILVPWVFSLIHFCAFFDHCCAHYIARHAFPWKIQTFFLDQTCMFCTD